MDYPIKTVEPAVDKGAGMRNCGLLVITTLLTIVANAQQFSNSPLPSTPAVQAVLPLAFEPNQGQAPAPAVFVAHARGYTVHLSGRDLVLSMSGEKPASTQIHLRGDRSIHYAGQELLPGKTNYYIGSPAHWHVGVPQYRKVRAADVYSGIDVVFYGNERQVEYDFEVSPGADPSAIRLAFDPSTRIGVTADGDLGLSVAGHDLLLRRPVAYQAFGSSRKPVEARYVVVGNDVSIAVGAYNRRRTLVIDPVVTYATFVGGSGLDTANAVATDGGGNAYIAGQTCSATGLPLPTNAYKAYCDAYVTAVKADGTAALYTTYLGGSNGDVANAIAVDLAQNAVVVGTTNSAPTVLNPCGDFPVMGGFTSQLNGGCYGGGDTDAFVSVLTPSGTLSYSTYLGGTQNEAGNGVVVDPKTSNIIVVGQTGSTDFPTVPASAFPGSKFAAFITELQAPGYSTALFSRYFEASPSPTCDSANAVALDLLGDIYIAGTTIKDCLIPANAKAYMAKFDPAATSPVFGWVTVQTPSEGHGIAVDSLGNSIVVGTSTGAAWVEKINPVGSNVLFSNFMGTAGSANAVAVDKNGFIYLAGSTSGADFPTVAPTQGVLAGAQDAFLMKLDPSGSAQIFSTFFGGGGSDAGNGIAVPPDGSFIYVAGSTLSADLLSLINPPPASGALQSSYGGNGDAFLAKWTGTSLPYASLKSPSQPINFGDQALNTSSPSQTITLTNLGDGPLQIFGINSSGPFNQSHTCGATLGKDQSCAITVAFLPTAIGIQTGAVTVVDNAGTQTVSLSGNGTLPPDFTITPTPTANTVTAGGSAAYSLVVTPEGGISGTLKFTCSNVPPNSACSFSPSSMTLGSSPATVILTVSTQARAALAPGPFARPTYLANAIFQFSFGIFGIVAVIGRRSWRKRKTLAICALSLLLLVVVGCNFHHNEGTTTTGGAGTGTTSTTTGTTAGTYSFTVVGTATGTTSVTHQLTLNLTVN